jgi:hypothetical protein
METVTIYRTQYCRFRIEAQGSYPALFLFRVTFNSPSGADTDIDAVARQCQDQLVEALASNSAVADLFAHHRLSEIAEWLCEALFALEGIGVTVDVESDDSGATVTYGVLTPGTMQAHGD